MKIALAQLAPKPGDLESNLGAIRATVGEHPEAEIAVFPELFLSGYQPARAGELAISADHELIVAARAVAADAGTAIAFGFIEALDDGARANSVIAIDEAGQIAAVHRKTMLFGAAEDSAFTRGDELAIASLVGVSTGLLICFEVEFPEPARLLARAGAEMLLTVAANMEPYGPDHELASRARSMDNRRPQIYVNRVGAESGLCFVGGSRLIGAGGETIVQMGAGEEVVVGELDRQPVDPDVDYHRHVRTDLSVRGADEPARAEP